MLLLMPLILLFVAISEVLNFFAYLILQSPLDCLPVLEDAVIFFKVYFHSHALDLILGVFQYDVGGYDVGVHGFSFC